jgi:hypothetical protein
VCVVSGDEDQLWGRRGAGLEFGEVAGRAGWGAGEGWASRAWSTPGTALDFWPVGHIL